jgi:hypothetical protein
MSRRLFYLLALGAGALVLAALALWWPQAAAQAQCGSQASSCKNCHEVQAKKPVNNDGKSWHQSHAFGDFCANCHAGNVQATDRTAAHTAMIAPLSDIKANCAACHPSDTQTRAEKYAAILGVPVGNGGQGQGPAATTAATNSGPTPAPTATNPPSGSNQVVTGLVDYNQQNGQTAPGQLSMNWGNLISGALIAVMGIGGAAFVIFNERRLRAGRAPKAAELPATKTAPTLSLPATTPDLGDLVPQLQKLDPPALRALRRLTADPVAASELLVSLSRIDPRLIEAVRHLDRRELNLLMALAEEH